MIKTILKVIVLLTFLSVLLYVLYTQKIELGDLIDTKKYCKYAYNIINDLFNNAKLELLQNKKNKTYLATLLSLYLYLIVYVCTFVFTYLFIFTQGKYVTSAFIATAQDEVSNTGPIHLQKIEGGNRSFYTQRFMILLFFCTVSLSVIYNFKKTFLSFIVLTFVGSVLVLYYWDQQNLGMVLNLLFDVFFRTPVSIQHIECPNFEVDSSNAPAIPIASCYASPWYKSTVTSGIEYLPFKPTQDQFSRPNNTLADKVIPTMYVLDVQKGEGFTTQKLSEAQRKELIPGDKKEYLFYGPQIFGTPVPNSRDSNYLSNSFLPALLIVINTIPLAYGTSTMSVYMENKYLLKYRRYYEERKVISQDFIKSGLRLWASLVLPFILYLVGLFCYVTSNIFFYFYSGRYLGSFLYIRQYDFISWAFNNYIHYRDTQDHTMSFATYLHQKQPGILTLLRSKGAEELQKYSDLSGAELARKKVQICCKMYKSFKLLESYFSGLFNMILRAPTQIMKLDFLFLLL